LIVGVIFNIYITITVSLTNRTGICIRKEGKQSGNYNKGLQKSLLAGLAVLFSSRGGLLFG